MTMYPTKPYSGVGIPSVFDTAPEITALQLITLLILQGRKGECVICSKSKYKARSIPKIDKPNTAFQRYVFIVISFEFASKAKRRVK